MRKHRSGCLTPAGVRDAIWSPHELRRFWRNPLVSLSGRDGRGVLSVPPTASGLRGPAAAGLKALQRKAARRVRQLLQLEPERDALGLRGAGGGACLRGRGLRRLRSACSRSGKPRGRGAQLGTRSRRSSVPVGFEARGPQRCQRPEFAVLISRITFRGCRLETRWPIRAIHTPSPVSGEGGPLACDKEGPEVPGEDTALSQLARPHRFSRTARVPTARVSCWPLQAFQFAIPFQVVAARGVDLATRQEMQSAGRRGAAAVPPRTPVHLSVAGRLISGRPRRAHPPEPANC